MSTFILDLWKRYLRGTICLLIIFHCNPVYANNQAKVKKDEVCENPKKLSAKLQKAYYQLKELEKELDGFSVKIKCYEKGVIKR